MAWFDRHPTDLLDRSEPSEALEALKELDTLTPARRVALDMCLSHWVLMLLLRPNDMEGLLELQDLCELAQELLADTRDDDAAEGEGEAPAERFVERWRAFHELLEGKRLTLEANARDDRAPSALLHEEAILGHAAAGEFRQSELVARLKLSPGRVSQLLGVLEAQGKIVRQRRGKESWVSVPVVPAVEATTAAEAAQAQADAAQEAGYLINRVFRRHQTT